MPCSASVRPLPVGFHMPLSPARRFQKKVSAGADCLSLRAKAPFFYTAGLLMNEILRDPELANFLMETFQVRYRELLSKCLCLGSGQEVLQLQSKMCAEETRREWPI